MHHAQVEQLRDLANGILRDPIRAFNMDVIGALKHAEHTTSCFLGGGRTQAVAVGNLGGLGRKGVRISIRI